MTRDEALRAARAGKKLRHPKAPVEYMYIYVDSLWYYNDGDREPFCCHFSLASQVFDEGWEVVKEKVKKTFWINIHEKDLVNKRINYNQLYETKQEAYNDRATEAITWLIKSIPIEIEVEE